MDNIKSSISGHSKKILSKMNHKKYQENDMCNCRKDSCPLNSKCVQENVLYKATITTQNEIKEYIGSTGGLFKKRWYAHIISDIRNENTKEQNFPSTFGN